MLNISQMKHLLLSAAAYAAIFSATAVEREILWQAESPEGVSLTWGNGDINITPEACVGFTAGGKIEIRLDKQDEAMLKLCYDKPDDGWTDVLSFSLEGENPVTATTTLIQSQVDVMKDYGFLPFGFGVSIHQIVYMPSEVNVDENAIWVGPKNFQGFGSLDFPSSFFSGAKVGDKLVFMISDSDNPFIKLLFGSWGGIEINTNENADKISVTDNSISVTLTQEYVDKLKANGLTIQADRFTLNQLLLIPENVTTGIADIVIDCNDCPVEYYNLQGIRVNNPENGIFIRRQGDKTIKIIK